MNDQTSDAAEILDLEFGDDQEYQEMLAEERIHSRTAKAVHDARNAAGLTQKQLASLVGTTQSVISRLEDGDYNKHSLAMLERVGRALHQRVEVRFIPLTADTEQAIAA
jgi:ribosome-binding protein aMBF1 (putative translation factor)